MSGKKLISILVLSVVTAAAQADPPSLGAPANEIPKPLAEPSGTPPTNGASGSTPGVTALRPLVISGPAPQAGPPQAAFPAGNDLPPPEPLPPAPPVPVTEVFQEEGPRWNILGGAGFTLTGRYLDNNRALTTSTPTGNGGRDVQSTGFDNPFEVSPRFWLGVANVDGWGFRTSFWNFSQSTNMAASLDGSSPPGSVITSASPVGLGISTGTFLLAPGNADVMAVSTRLNLTVLDFEATRELDAGPLFLVLSAGARYAHLSQRYNATVSNTSNDFSNNAEVDQLSSHQHLSAGGPTMALQGWYPLGRTRFSLYGMARGSILFGEMHQAASTSQTLAQGGSVGVFPLSSLVASGPTVVPVGEVELGVQWTACWRRFHPFLRTGIQAQTWFNALSTAAPPTGNGDSANLNSNLSFLGVIFQAGVNY
jgi:hypothetical protein